MSSEAWFSAENKLVEALLKLAVAQHVRGFLDPWDYGSAYDCTILMPQTYELKYDKHAEVTGNLYFETRNTYQDKPSGLTATTAQFWAHYVPFQHLIALYRPQRMLAFLEHQLTVQAPGYRRTRPHGGDHNSQGIIAPIESILAQKFVQRIPFKVELPVGLPTLSGVIGECHQCHRRLAIEALKFGVCPLCQEQSQIACAGRERA